MDGKYDWMHEGETLAEKHEYRIRKIVAMNEQCQRIVALEAENAALRAERESLMARICPDCGGNGYTVTTTNGEPEQNPCERCDIAAEVAALMPYSLSGLVDDSLEEFNEKQKIAEKLANLESDNEALQLYIDEITRKILYLLAKDGIGISENRDGEVAVYRGPKRISSWLPNKKHALDWVFRWKNISI